MKPVARKFLFLFIVCVVACSALAQTRPAAPSPRVLMVGSTDNYWLATVIPPADKDGKTQSVLYHRTQGEEKFNVIARMEVGISGLARWSSSAVILLDDGQWLPIGAGAGSGAPLPAGGRMLAIGSDGKTLWAVGSVKGGMEAALAAARPATQNSAKASTSPTTALAASVAPSTHPSATTTMPATTAASNGAAVILFRLNGVRWEPLYTLPENLQNAAPLSMGAGATWVALAGHPAGQEPVVLYVDLTNGAQHSYPFSDATSVQMLHSAQPEFWVRRQQGPGSLMRLENGVPVEIAAIDPAVIPPGKDATMDHAMGFLRVLSIGEQVVEQRLYDDGQPKDHAQPISSRPPPDEVPVWTNYVEGSVLLLLTIAILFSYRHRDAVRLSLTRPDRPRPARIWIRLSAAAVDAMPVFIGSAVAIVRLKPGEINSPNIAMTIPFLVGVAVYLLHTTISELIYRKTIGKWIFSLGIVTILGERPKAGAILIRNLLRLIDLVIVIVPILMVLLSPLRQRAGDAAAGTIVIDLAAPKMTDKPPGTQQS
jgi:uncharacterized RDD family membrane protein YckC